MTRIDRRPRTSDAFSELPADDALRLDVLCDCFEQQLAALKQPSIENFLGGCQVPARQVLLAELLALEIEFLVRGGRTCELAGYLARFPEEAALVRELFAELCPSALPENPTPRPAADAKLKIPNYILLSELGGGGMGTVYHAIQTWMKSDVAIKVLKTGREDDEDLRALFQKETVNLGQLRHAHIVQAMYAGVSEDLRPYLVMEMVQGLDLAQVLQRCGPMPVADACEVARQAALGLQHASECGMVHCDIKPSNLLLGWLHPRGQRAEVKVADFGLARLRTHTTRTQAADTKDRIMGTFDYMAPEQFFAPSEVDIRADIYGLGAALYTMLAGQPPYAGPYRNRLEMMIARRDEDVAPFRHLRPDVPPAFEEVILWSMARDPRDRFETPQEFAQSLGHFNGGHDLAALLEMAEELRVDNPVAIPAAGTTAHFEPPHSSV